MRDGMSVIRTEEKRQNHLSFAIKIISLLPSLFYMNIFDMTRERDRMLEPLSYSRLHSLDSLTFSLSNKIDYRNTKYIFFI